MFDSVETIALCIDRKQRKSFGLKLEVSVCGIYFFMRVDFLEGWFGCYCFQGFCLSGLCLIFHLHDIFLGNLFQAWHRDGPY